MGFISSLVLVSIVTAIIYFIAKHLQLRERLKDINCPRSYPLLGHVLLMKPDMEGFINQIMGMAYMYPDSPRMALLWLGPKPVLMVYSARLAEKILTSSKHLSKGYAYYLMEAWLGQGIITSNVDHWRPMRKLLTPTFHSDILRDYVPIFNEQARILTKKFASLPKEEPVELMSYLTLCALDIICETSMGKKLNAQLDKESEYVKAVHTMNDLVQKKIRNPLWWNSFIYNKYGTVACCNHPATVITLKLDTILIVKAGLPKFGETSDNVLNRFMFGEGELEKKCIDILHSFTQKVIEERHKELEEREWRFEGRLAFLDLLLDMVNNGQLDASEIQQQVDTLMFAGHDTTSTGSSWALWLFGCYPEIQGKVQEEIDEVLDDSDYILPEHLPQLKYLECCLKESLRVCTIVPMIMRQLGADQELEGVTLPEGTQVIINQHEVHRDPMYWPDPEKFDPDRFGLMEMKVVVTWILRHFNVISVQKRCDLKTKIEIILRPEDGIRVHLEKRRPLV